MPRATRSPVQRVAVGGITWYMHCMHRSVGWAWGGPPCRSAPGHARQLPAAAGNPHELTCAGVGPEAAAGQMAVPPSKSCCLTRHTGVAGVGLTARHGHDDLQRPSCWSRSLPYMVLRPGKRESVCGQGGSRYRLCLGSSSGENKEPLLRFRPSPWLLLASRRGRPGKAAPACCRSQLGLSIRVHSSRAPAAQ